MREELTKLERYQKQFKFLYQNGIETGNQLSALQKAKEQRMDALIAKREHLYSARTTENALEVKEQAKEINTELAALRSEVRICKAIFADSYKIAEKKRQAEELILQAEREAKEHEHKRRGR